MIDLHSPAESLTIQLPTDLVSVVRQHAEEKQITVDVVVREACLAYLEPYIWERCYQDLVRCQLRKSL